jgi:hypothetical protein
LRMSILSIVAVVVIAAGVIVFVLKGPDLGSGERGERGTDAPRPLSSEGRHPQVAETGAAKELPGHRA